MKHRSLLRLSIVAAVLALIVCVEPTRVIWGWLRGEAFYQGRPTSYWALRIRPWSDISLMWGAGGNFWSSETYHYAAVRDPIAAWIGQYVTLPEIPWPAVLDGDPESAPVLNELLEHPEAIVRQWAAEGLHRIGEPATGPMVSVTRTAGQPARPVPGTGGPAMYRVRGGIGPGAF